MENLNFGSVTLNPKIPMEAQIIQIGAKCLIQSSTNEIYRCKDLQEAIKTANAKGYHITNKHKLSNFFSKQLNH